MNKASSLAMALDPLEYEAAHDALTSRASKGADKPHALKGAELKAPFNDKEARLFSALNAMDSHNLVQQNSAALMDRIDTKYLVPRQYLQGLLAALSKDYSVLCENHKRIFTYETTYFDTPNKHFYHAHHNGHLNRRKVRYRRYVESNLGFMEVKLKNNKRRTIKKRVPMDSLKSNDKSVKEFVNQCLIEGKNQQSLSFKELQLNTSLFVNYRRITLLNKHHQERLTIDVDLQFQCSQSNNSRKLDELFIIEVKRDAKQQFSSFSNVVKQLALKPINFSKYCMGLALTHDGQLKTNRFKQTLLRVEKMLATENLAEINQEYKLGD